MFQVLQSQENPHLPSAIMKFNSPLLHPAHLVAALAFTALLAVPGHTSAATVFWDGNLSTTWDASAQNWKTLVSGGTSTAFTTNDTVTFGVTSPGTQTVVVTPGGVSTGLFTISSGTAWNFSGGNITAFSETTQNSIGNATTFTDMSFNLTRNGSTGTSVGVTITANVTLTSSTAKISTWRGPLAGFSLTTGKTLTLAGSAILDANKILSKSGLQGTIIINDNAVLKGAAFGSSNAAGTFLQPIDLNGGTLTATTLTSAGGGVAITWSGGVIRPTTTAGISYGTNANGVVNTIVLDGAGGGTFNGLDYNTNTVSTITIDNAITESGGSYGVTLTGGGNLTLNGNNTYTGATTISAGTLVIGSTGLLGGGNYSQSIANSGTFLFGSNSNQTLGGIISGSGAVTKNGTGTLTLSGNNTYSGATTISAGTLVITSTGLLGGGNYSQSIANNGAFLFGSNSNQTLGGIISGTGALTKDGTGTLTLSGNNTYSGTTTISVGTLQANHANALGNGGNITFTSGTLQYTANSNATDWGARFKNSTSAIALDTNSTNVTLSAAIDATNTGGLTKLATGTLTLSGNNTYSGATTISAGTLVITSTGLLGGGNYSQSIANNGAFLFGSNSDQTLSGTISGSGALTKNGTGMLTLSGNNSGTGGVTLTAGTLNINSATALGATASALNINGGTIDNTSGSAKALANNNPITLGGNFSYSTSAGTAANDLNLGTGVVSIGSVSRTITLNGAGALIFGGVLTNTVNSNMNVTVTNGSGTTSTSAVSFGGVSRASADTTNRSINFFGDGNINITGAIVNGGASATLGVAYSGNSTLSLSGANTYAGATVINSGVLDAIDGMGLPTLTALQLKGGVFQSSGNFTRLLNTGNGKFNFGGSGGTGSSGGFAARGGVLNLQLNNGTSSLMWGNASTQVAGDGFSLIFGSSTADNRVDFQNGLNLGNGTVATRTITVIDNPNSSADIARISGNIMETTVGMGLLKDGNGTLELTGTNTYTGATTISAGTLQIGAGGTSGAISSTSGITNNGTLVINRSDALTVSTVISGTGALTKNGSGILTLTGNNTYTGATTVNAGTLQAAATQALGNSTVINVNGGSFLVTAENAVNDTAAINLGGGRMAVSGTFNETVGLLTLSANSTIDLAGYNGTLRFSGVGSWAAGTNLAIWNWNGINKYGTPVGDGLNNRHVVFTDATGLDTYLDRISFYSGSGTGFSGSGFAQGFSGGGTEIIAVPETETYFYAVALLAGVVVQYLRRRARRKLLKSHRPA